MTIILAEQNAVKALEIANRVLVLSLGKIFLLENANKLDQSKLKEAYQI